MTDNRTGEVMIRSMELITNIVKRLKEVEDAIAQSAEATLVIARKYETRIADLERRVDRLERNEP